jgi:hypothetical protein
MEELVPSPSRYSNVSGVEPKYIGGSACGEVTAASTIFRICVYASFFFPGLFNPSKLPPPRPFSLLTRVDAASLIRHRFRLVPKNHGKVLLISVQILPSYLQA